MEFVRIRFNYFPSMPPSRDYLPLCWLFLDEPPLHPMEYLVFKLWLLRLGVSLALNLPFKQRSLTSGRSCRSLEPSTFRRLFCGGSMHLPTYRSERRTVCSDKSVRIHTLYSYWFRWELFDDLQTGVSSPSIILSRQFFIIYGR